jgi:hypothetical protein
VHGPKKPTAEALKVNGSLSLAQCSKVVLGSCAEVSALSGRS